MWVILKTKVVLKTRVLKKKKKNCQCPLSLEYGISWLLQFRSVSEPNLPAFSVLKSFHSQMLSGIQGKTKHEMDFPYAVEKSPPLFSLNKE